ncbi:MAG: flagellar basal body rod protein FlgB [Gammaproteobacteria bacterium]|nr:flagellar basal body rod protein FlgB [Gammaproteobacteria bacterium]MDH4310669.1 flagellar basal body rod protein FlgB [Gammaproteobacteria bacterium]MDH5272368.1 flagellar basal body rod protein FlgB [Gammaproteobacteria bacterium]
MNVRNDPIFGIHGYALALRSQRMQVLASNLANADTPGFKARDLDFQELLSGEGSSPLPLSVSHAVHIAAGDEGGLGATAKYRVPLQPSLDGNTVDAQMDQARFAENALSYQVSLTFVSSRLGSLLTAITGNA